LWIAFANQTGILEGVDCELIAEVKQKQIEAATSRVAPANFSAGALARSVRGQFDHTAPPLIRLMEIARGLHTPLAGEVGTRNAARLTYGLPGSASTVRGSHPLDD
jgi:hypothetical protein